MEIEQMPWVSCRCPISICVAARKRAYFSSFSAIGPILWKVMRELVVGLKHLLFKAHGSFSLPKDPIRLFKAHHSYASSLLGAELARGN
jgi:hypothetical protein